MPKSMRLARSSSFIETGVMYTFLNMNERKSSSASASLSPIETWFFPTLSR